MDIQTRKIAFMQTFLQLQNEELLTCLEEVLHSGKKQHEESLSPMTVAELNQRVDCSIRDAKDGCLTATEDLLAEIQQWH